MRVPAGGEADAAEGQALRVGGGVLVAGVAGVAGAADVRGAAGSGGEEWEKAETERGERVGLRGEERREVVGESRGAMTSPGMCRSTAAAHMTLFLFFGTCRVICSHGGLVSSIEG